MSLTLGEFSTILSSVTVTGVVVYQTTPPTILNSTNLPQMYFRVPTIENAAVSFSGGSDIDRVQLEIVIIVAAYSLGRSDINFVKVRTMVDELNLSLKTAMAANPEIDSWTIGFGSENDELWTINAVVQGSR